MSIWQAQNTTEKPFLTSIVKAKKVKLREKLKNYKSPQHCVYATMYLPQAQYRHTATILSVLLHFTTNPDNYKLIIISFKKVL